MAHVVQHDRVTPGRSDPLLELFNDILLHQVGFAGVQPLQGGLEQLDVAQARLLFSQVDQDTHQVGEGHALRGRGDQQGAQTGQAAEQGHHSLVEHVFVQGGVELGDQVVADVGQEGSVVGSYFDLITLVET